MSLKSVIYEIQSKQIQVEKDLKSERLRSYRDERIARIEYLRVLHESRKSFRSSFENCIVKVAEELYFDFRMQLDGKVSYSISPGNLHEYFMSGYAKEYGKLKEASDFANVSDLDVCLKEAFETIIRINGRVVNKTERIVLTEGEKRFVVKEIRNKFQSRNHTLGKVLSFTFDEIEHIGKMVCEVIGPYQNWECQFELKKVGGSIFTHGYLFN